MSAIVMDGKALAAKVKEKVRAQVEGMAQKPGLVRNCHTAQYKRAPLHQAVHIISVANTESSHHASLLFSQMASATGRSSGVVIFMFS